MDERLDALLSKQEITEALYLVARGTDRQDIAMFGAQFHEDGTDYHGLANGPVQKILDVLGRSKLLKSQHAISNVMIELEGDVAHVESCFNAFHQNRDAEGALWDEELRGRYLDRFERRTDRRWKIAQRTVVWDWSRIQPSTRENWFDQVAARPGADNRFIFGQRDKSDMVYTRRLPEELAEG